MDISDSQVERSLQRTEQRRAEAIAARRRQKLMAVLGLALLVVLIAFGGMLLGARSSQAPAVSTLVLDWPTDKSNRYDSQIIVGGSTILIEKGRPVRLSVPQTGIWDVVWKTGDKTAASDVFNWMPSSNSAVLTVQIRPRAAGWKKLFAWSRPVREFHLRGLAGSAVANGDGAKKGPLREIETPGGGLWLGNRILAKVPVRYDERALQSLGIVAQQLKQTAGDSATADAPVWQVIPSFTGDKALPGDKGTSVLLKTAKPAEDARKAFQILHRLAPEATIKVIVEKGKADEPGEARFRLSFDGKGGRFVWVQNQGEEKADPEDWLEDGDDNL